MTVPSLRIGLPRLTGKLVNHAKRYGIVEVHADELPNKAGLRRWRAQVPPSFAFSVRLPKAVCALASGRAAEVALSRALESADALEANCIVLATPASIRPTQQHRDRIIELGLKLPPGAQLPAWEPSGIWSPDEITAVAQAGRWLVVSDAAQGPLEPGPIAYTRIRALGKAMRLGPGRLQRIAEQLVGRREAYVIADPTIAPKLVSALPIAVASLAAASSVPQLFRPTPSLELGLHDEEQ